MEGLVAQPWSLDWLLGCHRGLLTCPVWGLNKLITGAWRGDGLWGLGRCLWGSTDEGGAGGRRGRLHEWRDLSLLAVVVTGQLYDRDDRDAVAPLAGRLLPLW